MIRKKRLKKEDKVKVTFVLPEGHPRLPASVVGEFNDWDPLVDPLKRRSNQTHSVAVMLEPGNSYRFRYLGDGGHWFDEADADAIETNGHGTVDCIVET